VNLQLVADSGRFDLMQAALALRSGGHLDLPSVAHLMALDSRSPVLMSLAPSDVHIASALTKMLVAYSNREFVADMVSPVVAVDKRTDFIFQLPVDTMQTVANAQLAGQRARPNEIKYSINHTLTYNVKDYGLIDFVSKDEIANADAPLRPYDYAQRIVVNFLKLAREIRVAAVTFATGSYGANVSTLSGANRWDTPTGDPVADILAAQEVCFVRPNVFTIGGQVWPKLRTNPNVIKYVLGRPSTKSGATPLVVDLDTFAQAFELDRVVIGRAKYNSAAEGATAVSSYIWGKSATLTRVEEQPNPRETSAFQYTYRFGSQTMQTQIVPELLAGVRGGDYIKVTHSDDDRVVGGVNSGYMFATVIS
jgi:hypothetical protein